MRHKGFDALATNGIACESIGHMIRRDMYIRHHQNKWTSDSQRWSPETMRDDKVTVKGGHGKVWLV